jgi:hypothetical protein
MSDDQVLSYRAHGGPMKVDQRLTVREDGSAQLEERHRRRGPTELALGSGELDGLRAALEAVPESHWSRVPPALRIRRGDLWRIFGLSQRHFAPTGFRVSREGRNLSGWLDDPDPALQDLLRRLEDVRARAVREAEAVSPT